MILLIIFIPLLSFLLCSFFGRFIGKKGVIVLSIFLLSVTWFITVVLFFEVNNKNIFFTLKFINWLNIGLFCNNFSFIFNYLVCSMLLLINSISLLVHIYSCSYMGEDPHLQRFMSYLSLFTFFMIILVTGENIIQLFIGWEGVGLCSFLLINFWYTRLQANKSAIKAMLVNKIGDIGLLYGIILIWKVSGLLVYSELFPLFLHINDKSIAFINLLLMIGVVGKSAQFGLHMWLPDAMEGPTPVSALIHAATMVTAGVFLLIKVSPLFELSSFVLIIVIFMGSLTSFFSAVIGLTQSDLKKVIAYSTCSQLGYMVMICGFSQYHVGLFHLINHGFFKALLFLSAGSIIHAISDEQDMRKFGNLKFFLPLSYICVLIGSLSLMGLPFLTGFYSKDLLIELVFNSHILFFAYILAIVSASLTAFYSFRLIYSSFFKFPQHSIYKNLHEGVGFIFIPLILLLIMSLSIGYMLKFFIIKDTSPIIISNFNKTLPLIVSIFGALFSIIICSRTRWFQIINYNLIYNFITKTWYIDPIINFYNKLLPIGMNNYKLIDSQFLEFLGPMKLHKNFSSNSKVSSNYHPGSLTIYMTFSVFFFFSFVFWVYTY